MKKNYAFLAACVAVSSVAASAQQLPNVGFEEPWVECIPWTSTGNTKPKGEQPASWTVANVIGMGGNGATVVGSNVAGYESESAVKLTNTPNPIMATQIVPAYVTLGITWATSQGVSPIKNKDGGTFGGRAFTFRPDAIAFEYQREYSEGKEENAQNATVLVYSWKGQWQQAEVPGANAILTPKKVTMTDRDRNILGMETAQGGAVTHSDDALLISKSLTYIEGQTTEWKSYIAPIEYFSDDAPEQINVILAANDYFDSNNIVNGNSLTVDNVRFIYYSRLSGVEVAGVAVPDFAPDTYTYNVDAVVPAAADVKPVLLGQGKSAAADVAVDGNKVTVTVHNANGADVDGESQHVYTLNFKEAPVVVPGDIVKYDGVLNIEMMDGPVGDKDQAATIEIQSMGTDLCKFTLPNFSLDLGDGPVSLGDIVVDNVKITNENGVDHYAGQVKGLSLLGGEIIADVDLTGTIDAAGNADMNIDVKWGDIPIKVTFVGKKVTGICDITVDADAPAEYYNLNGVRVSGELAPGLYIRRQGNSVSKVVVK